MQLKFARVVDGVVVDMATDPVSQFHESIASEFVEVPTNVAKGWRLVDEVWQAPQADAVDAGQAVRKVTPPQFKLLWEPAERIAITRIRRSTDEDQADLRDSFEDFFSIVDDPRLTEIDLTLASVQVGVTGVLQVLHAAGVVADIEVRKAAILSGLLV